MTEIDSLTLAQLTALIKAAQTRLKRLASRRPLAVVRREVQQMATSHGYAIGEILDLPSTARAPTKRAAKRKTTKVAPKYRDPDSRRNTWSGRGRAPRWLAEKIKRGQSAADFLIPGLARPTVKKGGDIGRRSVFKQP